MVFRDPTKLETSTLVSRLLLLSYRPVTEFQFIIPEVSKKSSKVFCLFLTFPLFNWYNFALFWQASYDSDIKNKYSWLSDKLLNCPGTIFHIICSLYLTLKVVPVFSHSFHGKTLFFLSFDFCVSILTQIPTNHWSL